MTGGSRCQPVLGPSARMGLVLGLLQAASVRCTRFHDGAVLRPRHRPLPEYCPVHEGQQLYDQSSRIFHLHYPSDVELSEKHAFNTHGSFNESVRNISAWHLWQPDMSPDDMSNAAHFMGQTAADELCKRRQCK